MLFFIIGSSPRTFAISAGVSLLAYFLSAVVDHLRGWTLDLGHVTLLFTVLGLAVLALTTCRSDPITSLLSHVGHVMSRSLFGPHGAHIHRGGHKAGQAAVDVLPRLQALPIELWKPVASLSVEELVRRLKAMGALPDPRPLERHELESAYVQAAEPTCAICQEDYQEGDACRMLWPKCRHAYHVECFDRWALPACESAPTACASASVTAVVVLELAPGHLNKRRSSTRRLWPSRRSLRVPMGGIQDAQCARRRSERGRGEVLGCSFVAWLHVVLGGMRMAHASAAVERRSNPSLGITGGPTRNSADFSVSARNASAGYSGDVFCCSPRRGTPPRSSASLRCRGQPVLRGQAVPGRHAPASWSTRRPPSSSDPRRRQPMRAEAWCLPARTRLAARPCEQRMRGSERSRTDRCYRTASTG